jgi:hypothetical protein
MVQSIVDDLDGGEDYSEGVWIDERCIRQADDEDRINAISCASAISSPRLKITLTFKIKEMHARHVHESPRTLKIVLERRHGEEGPESPRKCRIEVKAK